MKKYSDITKNRLCLVYNYVVKHFNSNFTYENIRKSYLSTQHSYTYLTVEMFVNKFLSELEDIKKLVNEQPFKKVKFIKEHEDSITNEMVIDNYKINNYFDWDLIELEYRISLTSRHYNRFEIINTNIN